jgi:hypothetical protein
VHAIGDFPVHEDDRQADEEQEERAIVETGHFCFATGVTALV